MRSATGLTPTESIHVRRSELCATCHTLFTTALDAEGRAVGRLPEQVPFLEWQHSAYNTERSCQDCHMPPVAEPTPIASVLGEPREGLSRHTFLGGNFFMLRMLNRYRNELGVTAPPHELEAAAMATERQLRADTATLRIADARRTGSSATFTVIVENLTGHKLPTGYPSRRAWLHVTARDATGQVLFESGAVAPTGAIAGNANDEDPARYEPHYDEIRSADQVQIYESVMVDLKGTPTTGLLQGVRYVKDNRLLPRGFDKSTASARRGGPRCGHRRCRLPVRRRSGALRDRRVEGAGTGHAARRSSDSRPSPSGGRATSGPTPQPRRSASPPTTTPWRRDRRSRSRAQRRRSTDRGNTSKRHNSCSTHPP